MLEGLYEGEDEGVRFHAVAVLSEAAILQVQERVRRRVLKACVRWELLEADAREEMLGWRHGGGFSLDASVRIAADDRDGRDLTEGPVDLRSRSSARTGSPGWG